MIKISDRGLTDAGPLLQERFSELLSWERIKKRERIAVSVFFYSVLASVIVLPAKELLPPWVSPLSLPLLFFLFLAPGFFLLTPWGSRESVRSVFLLDKTLHLEERAITAWEILSRKEKEAAELLVLEEAAEKLRGVDPRALFKRQPSWHALLASPLLLLWLLLVWLDIGFHSEKGFQRSQSTSLANQVKEFAQEIQEKAKSEQLAESLKVARALEEVAEESLRGGISEKRLGENLAGMVNEIADAGPAEAGGADISFPTATREGLSDLKAELETFKHTLTLPDSAWQEEKLGSEVLGRLATLPRLSEEIEKRLLSIEKLGGKELSRFLDKLEKGVVAELDRRTLMEIREFLSLLLKGSKGIEGEGAAEQRAEKPPQVANQAEGGRLLQAERVGEKGSLPGDQPGAKGPTPQTPPPFKGRAAAYLKGLLGEGRSDSLTLRGEPSRQESKISQEEIFTSYRRQAEEELASERIPEALKETIKRYFLSLGMTEDKRGK